LQAGSVTTHAEDPPVPPVRVELFGPGRRAATVGLLLLTLVTAFEAMGVGTAMPAVIADLGAVSAYALPFTAFLAASVFGTVLGGRWCDAAGPRAALLATPVLFGVGLVVAGTADALPQLLVGRLLQGFGAGAQMIAGLVTIAAVYPERARPAVFGLLSSAWVLPSLVGPPVAGLLADHLSWRWVFLGVLPLLLGAALLVWPHLSGMDGPAADAVAGPQRRRRLLPALVAAVGVGLLQLGGQLLADVAVPAALLVAAGAVLLALGLPRLLPRGAFRLARGLPTVVAMRGVLAGAFFGAETFLPLMLVEQRGLATTLAGASLTGAALTWSLGAWLQGRPGRRTPRWVLLTLGFVLVLAGIGVAALATDPAVPAVTAALGWAVAGLGMGLGLTSLSVLVLELSAPGEQGANASALQVSDALGSIVLIGTAGAIFAGFAGGGRSPGATPFLVIDAVMAVVCVGGALVAYRVRPAGDTR
jgi:MFS family permease